MLPDQKAFQNTLEEFVHRAKRSLRVYIVPQKKSNLLPKKQTISLKLYNLCFVLQKIYCKASSQNKTPKKKPPQKIPFPNFLTKTAFQGRDGRRDANAATNEDQMLRQRTRRAVFTTGLQQGTEFTSDRLTVESRSGKRFFCKANEMGKCWRNSRKPKRFFFPWKFTGTAGFVYWFCLEKVSILRNSISAKQTKRQEFQLFFRGESVELFPVCFASPPWVKNTNTQNRIEKWATHLKSFT